MHIVEVALTAMRSNKSSRSFGGGGGKGNGILVSNHGGWQLDYSLASVSVLEEVNLPSLVL